MNEDQAKQILRRLDSIEKVSNLTYKDRDILEDILLKIDALKGQVHTLEERINLLEKRVDKGDKNIVADLAEVHNKVEETKESVEQLGN